MAQTLDTLQVYALVPSPKPNTGAPSTKDATNLQVATAYEANPDTNKFTDALKAKLIALLTIVDSDDVPQGTTNLYMTSAEQAKLLSLLVITDSDDVPEGAINLYFTSAEASKLAGIQAGAQVNPATSDAVPEGATNKYMSTEAKRIGVVTPMTSASNIFDPLPQRELLYSLTGNIANLTPSQNGAFDGQLLLFCFKQDATGSRTVTFDVAKFQGGLDVAVPVISGVANSRSYILVAWNGTDNKFDFLSSANRYP